MDNTKNVVLVPTDFTEVADNAINQACEVARFLNDMNHDRMLRRSVRQLQGQSSECVSAPGSRADNHDILHHLIPPAVQHAAAGITEHESDPFPYAGRASTVTDHLLPNQPSHAETLPASMMTRSALMGN